MSQVPNLFQPITRSLNLEMIDLIAYSVVIVIVIVVLNMESRHFYCDQLGCDSVRWARERSKNDRDVYVNHIKIQTHQSIWMRAFLVATVLAILITWWFVGILPPFMVFLPVLLIIFVVYYFSFNFYQHHQLEPINRDTISYIEANCSLNDQRKVSSTDQSTVTSS